MREIKEDVKEAVWEVVDWIHLDLNMVSDGLL
jgi:hypothetical protein